MINHVYNNLFCEDSVDKQIIITETITKYDDNNNEIKEESVILTNENIYNEQFTLEESICSQEYLEYGSCESSMIKLKIFNIDTTFKGKWLNVGIQLEDHTDIFPIGTYKVDEDTLDSSKEYRELVAYDVMKDILDTNYVSFYNQTLFPDVDTKRSIKEIRDMFFEYVGIEQEYTSLINDDIIVGKTIDSDEISGAMILNALCQLNAVFGHISRDNKFKYVSLNKNAKNLYPAKDIYPAKTIFPNKPETSVNSNTEYTSLYPSDDLYLSDNRYLDTPQFDYSTDSSKYFECVFEDFESKKITVVTLAENADDNGIETSLEDFQFENDVNVYRIEDNFLIYGLEESVLNLIGTRFLTKVRDLYYTPVKIKKFGNLCEEVGDSIYLYDKKLNRNVFTYILSRTVTGVQNLIDTIETKGSEVYSQNINSTERSIKKLKSMTHKLEVSQQSLISQFTQVEQNLQGQLIDAESKFEQTAESIKARVEENSESLVDMIQDYSFNNELSYTGASGDWFGNDENYVYTQELNVNDVSNNRCFLSLKNVTSSLVTAYIQNREPILLKKDNTPIKISVLANSYYGVASMQITCAVRKSDGTTKEESYIFSELEKYNETKSLALYTYTFNNLSAGELTVRISNISKGSEIILDNAHIYMTLKYYVNSQISVLSDSITSKVEGLKLRDANVLKDSTLSTKINGDYWKTNNTSYAKITTVSGTKMLSIQLSGASATGTYIKYSAGKDLLPSDAARITLKFNCGFKSSAGSIRIQYSRNDSSWTTWKDISNIQTFTNNSDMKDYSVTLTNVSSGSFYFRIYNRTSNSDMYISDIQLFVPYEVYAESVIKQTQDEIELLTKNLNSGESVSLKLSSEKNEIKLNAGRLVITGGNFKLDKDGNVTASNATLSNTTVSGSMISNGSGSTSYITGGYIYLYNSKQTKPNIKNANLRISTNSTSTTSAVIQALKGGMVIASNDSMQIASQSYTRVESEGYVKINAKKKNDDVGGLYITDSSNTFYGNNIRLMGKVSTSTSTSRTATATNTYTGNIKYVSGLNRTYYNIHYYNSLTTYGGRDLKVLTDVSSKYSTLKFINGMLV